MRINYRLILLCVVLVNVLSAQKWDHYEPLEAKGPIPADFSEAYLQKLARDQNKINQNKSRKERKQKENFFKQSEYAVNKYLISGNVIFGDTISQYCEAILDQILADKPELRSKLRIYTVKNPLMNAVATANGIILVNVGLLAEVENEAQLAYILAHEVIHYKEKHVLDQFIEREKMKDGEDLYRNADRDERINKLSNYSQKLELEADELGFMRYYENSGYSPVEVNYLMDIMLYSYLPFDEVPFEPDFLSKGQFDIASEYLLEKVSPITAVEDYDDEYSTHPNIKKRRKDITSFIGNKEGGKLYQVSKSWFEYCQRLSRYEMSHIYVNRRQYPEAIYNTFLLNKTYGSDQFQQKIMAQALHGASAYRNEDRLDDVMTDWEEVEGESQQAYHILASMEPEELNTLAAVHAYDLYMEDTTNEVSEKIFRYVLADLVRENELHPDDFERARPQVDTSTIRDSVEQAHRRRSSKISKLKTRRGIQNITADNYKTAFVEYWQKGPFEKMFYETEDLVSDSVLTGWRDVDPSFTKKAKFEENKALGIDSIICFTPKYLKIDERKDNELQYVETAEKAANYRNQIREVSQQLDLHVELLDYKEITSSETDKFNDLILIDNWLYERLMHENTDMLLTDFDRIKKVSGKYNTPYVGLTGNLTLRVKEGAVAAKVVYAIIFPPYLPFAILDWTLPTYRSFNYFFLFDVRNGDPLLTEFILYDTKDGKYYVKNILYNHLLQIKDQPKL